MESRIQKATAQKPAQQKPLDVLKGVLASDKVRKRLEDTVGENAGAFTSSVIDLFSGDSGLMQCDPTAVVGEALRAAALKLPISKQLGFAYVVPFREKGVMKPVFVIGYKGYIQLALRSGYYHHINCGIVYDGELSSSNKLSGEINLDGEKASDKVIGYFAYIELLNGFSKTLYMSHDEVVKHALRRSKQVKDGKLTGSWVKEFDEMAQKTCIRLLIGKYGIMSVEMQKAFTTDNDEKPIETTSEPVETYDITDDIPDVDFNDTPAEVAEIEGGENNAE